jgi:hypothetical protein
MHTLYLDSGDIAFAVFMLVCLLGIAYYVGKTRGIQAERRLMAGELVNLRKMMP